MPQVARGAFALPLGVRFRAPSFWDERSWLSDAALPLSCAYAALTRLREAALPAPEAAAAPVVCVGSVLVGGVGKTPVTLAIAERLATVRPTAPCVHILSRGYGGAARGPLRVQLDSHDASTVGDEPLLLAEAAPTWVGARRADTAAMACAQGAQLLLMDDGLQHFSLRRDLSLLCVDSSYLLGNGRVLPAGPLREPLARALARADAVVVVDPAATSLLPTGVQSHAGPSHRSGDDDVVPPVEQANPTSQSAKRLQLRLELAMPASMPLLQAALVPDPVAASVLAGRPVLAFSGTARPHRFFDTLRALGCTFALPPIAMPDHAPLDAASLGALRRHASERGALLATTSKDAARLPAEERHGVSVLPVRLRWLAGASSTLDQLLQPLITSALDVRSLASD